MFYENREVILNLFNKKFIKEILKRSQQDILNQFETSPAVKHSYRTALISDMFGSIFCFYVKECAREIYKVNIQITGMSDSKSDLFIENKNIPLEVKVTCGTNWSGGEFSKRPYPTFLISYSKNFLEFFVCLMPNIRDWKSNIKNRRYGTSLSWKSIVATTNKYVLFGDIETNYDGISKMIRETV